MGGKINDEIWISEKVSLIKDQNKTELVKE